MAMCIDQGNGFEVLLFYIGFEDFFFLVIMHARVYNDAFFLIIIDDIGILLVRVKGERFDM